MDEQRLIDLLSVYRYDKPMPALPARRRQWQWWMAVAAVIVIAAMVVGWPRRRSAGWEMSAEGERRALRAGEAIAVGPAGARLESRGVGVVDIAGGSVLRFEGGNHLALDRGAIHAKTVSPPGVFVVDTPRARAIDLGCEYSLTIAPGGSGLLRVTSGWVELQRGWLQSLIPQGAKGVIGPDGNVSPPIFEDAPAAFQDAVIRRDLNAILALARPRDALTLINLFRDSTTDERLRLYDRLNQLVPAPADVPREAMRTWNLSTLNDWWPLVLKASGVQAIKKKKGMFHLPPDA